MFITNCWASASYNIDRSHGLKWVHGQSNSLVHSYGCKPRGRVYFKEVVCGPVGLTIWLTPLTMHTKCIGYICCPKELQRCNSSETGKKGVI